jgi:hypothetical protein
MEKVKNSYELKAIRHYQNPTEYYWELQLHAWQKEYWLSFYIPWQEKISTFYVIVFLFLSPFPCTLL